jgi:hypothetical protein
MMGYWRRLLMGQSEALPLNPPEIPPEPFPLEIPPEGPPGEIPELPREVPPDFPTEVPPTPPEIRAGGRLNLNEPGASA